MYITFVLLILVSTQFVLGLYQHNRYVMDVYDCSDMSIDCEEYFENIGLETKLVTGDKKDANSRHMWLIVDFGLFETAFESTKSMFVPKSYYDYMYENLEVSDGYFVDGHFDDDLIWDEL